MLAQAAALQGVQKAVTASGKRLADVMVMDASKLKQVVERVHSLAKRMDAVENAPQVAKSYVTRLEATLGNKEFEQVFASLKGDASVNQQVAVEICRFFIGGTAAGTPKSKCLDKIYERHKRLFNFKNSNSTDRRSAG